MIREGGLCKKIFFLIFSCFGCIVIDHCVLGSSIDSICAPEVCLNGSTSQLSVGVVLEDSLTSSLLVPGNYSRFRDASAAHANPGFTLYEQAGLEVAQTSPLIAYPRPLYRDQPRLYGKGSSNLSGPLGSFLLAQGYQATFGVNGVPRIAVHDSSPNIKQWNGLEGLELIAVESSNCPGGCGAGGNCSQTTCSCLPGYTGMRCDSCANGYFGPDCRQCPNCDNSSGITCDDGTTGTGTCVSLNSSKIQTPLLPISLSTCNCLNGVCTSTTSCLCSAGWTNSANGTLCASCMAGFFLDARGECAACGPACQSCDSPSGICHSCAQGFQVAKDDSTKCVPSTVDLIGGAPTSCQDGFYNSHNSTCAPCDPSCKSCFGPSSSSCTQCSPTQALLSTGKVDNNTLSASCVAVDPKTGICSSPPNSLFLSNQNKGICDPAPRLCSVASIPGFSPLYPGSISTADAVCSACVADALLLPTRIGVSEGHCVGACPNGTYDDRHGRCASCPVGCSVCSISGDGTNPRCTTCTDSKMLLSGGSCVQDCPAGTFAGLSTSDTPQAPKGVDVCLSCSASCGNCTQTPTTCQSCPKTRPAFDPTTQTCALACQKGRFPDLNAGGRCSLCETSCETCSGPGPGDCLSCKAGDTLQDGKCRASACATNTTKIVPGWGICLEDLVGANAETSTKGLPIWLIVLVTIFLSVSLSALCLIIWRFWQRKKRQAKTKQFGTELATADIKLHQLEGSVIEERYRPGWNATPMTPAPSSSPSPPTPTPSEFKIKRKVVPMDNRIDDGDRESISLYSHYDYSHHIARQNSLSDLPVLPKVAGSDETVAEDLDRSCRNTQGSLWVENGLERRPSQHFQSQKLYSPKSIDSFGFK